MERTEQRHIRWIGRKRYFDPIVLNCEFQKMCDNDEKAAELLRQSGLYNQAAYMYIQSMEKRIKGIICGKMNMGIKAFADRLRGAGHSLDISIELLISIMAAGDEVLKDQLTTQLVSGVFENQKFKYLNNNLRYPFYEEKNSNYSVLTLTDEDCERISQMNAKVKMYLRDIYMLQR